MNKGLCLVAMLFCFLPLVCGSLLISRFLDDDVLDGDDDNGEV